MAHWDHHRTNKGYAGTPSERTQIKKEHDLKEHSAFQLHKKELIRWKRRAQGEFSVDNTLLLTKYLSTTFRI